jgi:hypothetical protein
VAVTITITTGTIANALTAMGASGFAATCEEAMVIAATAVLGEDGTLPNAASRFGYARLVLANPTLMVGNAIWALVGDGVTVSGVTDQVLIDRVLYIWNQLCYGA